ncbi:Flp family type IVb pilin [Caulobacter sp. FWC2]|nr:Flp family type IVb pilin [Caulobacter sp. FWC2]PIB93642.1 Flp family type IVb pilin [Caulobacter sp. FWC2]
MAARSVVKRFWTDESGATAIEYGLIIGLIALILVGGMTAFSAATNKALGKASEAIGT